MKYLTLTLGLLLTTLTSFSQITPPQPLKITDGVPVLPLCENMNITAGTSWANDSTPYVVLSTSIIDESIDNSTIVSYEWNATDSAGLGWGGPSYQMQFNTMGNTTLYACVEIIGYNPPPPTSTFTQWFHCSMCNIIEWNGEEWVVSDSFGPEETDEVNNIQELLFESNFDNEYYNIYGQRYLDFESIPNNTIYIHNRKKHIKTQ